MKPAVGVLLFLKFLENSSFLTLFFENRNFSQILFEDLEKKCFRARYRDQRARISGKTCFIHPKRFIFHDFRFFTSQFLAKWPVF